jgi:hypothetical protein
MRKELDMELRKAHAECVYLELLRIDLPDSYENSIVNTQVFISSPLSITLTQRSKFRRSE